MAMQILVLFSLLGFSMTDPTLRDIGSDLQKSLNTPEAHRVHRARY